MAAVSLSGLASGFDWKTLVDQLAQAERSPQNQLRVDQDTLNQRNNAYTSIKTELTVLQSRIASLKDTSLYDSRTSSVTDTSVASSSVSSGAAIGSYAFDVTQLATASKRTGTGNVGKSLTPANSLATAGFSTAITAGTFTVNGKQVTIATSDTLNAVFGKISNATDGEVTASYDSGHDQIVLTGTDNATVVLSSATDTSNFLQVAKLYNNGTDTVSSANALGGVLLNATLSASNLTTAVTNGVTGQGEFKVNGVSIKFDATTDSVANILTRINNSAAGVTASYDSVNDRFQLTSKATGDMDIAMEDVHGNFLTATGLTTSTLSRGQNLLYTINGGDELVSQSNTIKDASSGITGLSLTAVNEGTVTVNVVSDNNKIKTAITDFVAQYNRVQSLISTDTASTTDSKGIVTAGILASDGDASDLAQSLRKTVFSQLSGLTGAFDHLADLGLQTSGDDDSLTLKDSDLLDSAISNNLNSIKDLFTNETSGIAVSLNKFLDRTIGDDGTLIHKQTTLTKQATDIDSQIIDLEKLVQADIDHWNNEFVSMEQTQQRINQQLQYLSRQFPA